MCIKLYFYFAFDFLRSCEWSRMQSAEYTYLINTSEMNQFHDHKMQLLSQLAITKMFSKATTKVRPGQNGNQGSPGGRGELIWGCYRVREDEMAELSDIR